MTINAKRAGKAKLAGGLVAAALVLGSVSPAMARPYWGGGWGGGYGYGGGWGRYHRRDNSGAVIGAILGVGIIAAIAASAANRDRYDDRRYDRRYDSRDGGPRYRDGAYAGENEAVDSCALAARDEGSRGGRFAEVRDITETRPDGDGWIVTGTLDARDGYAGGGTVIRAFSCSWLEGRANVRLS